MALGLPQERRVRVPRSRQSLDGRSPSGVRRVPDVVLGDEMDCSDEVGTLISQLKAAHPDAAVIVLTSSMEPAGLDAIFAAGAMGAIGKSTHPGAIATLVGETLNGRIIQIHRSLESSSSPTLSAVSRADGQLTARETRDPAARGRWTDQRRHRAEAVGHRADGEVPSVQHVPQAGRGNRTEASRYAHINGLVGEPCAVS